MSRIYSRKAKNYLQPIIWSNICFICINRNR